MQPLIDGDILLYEVGFGSTVAWDRTDEEGEKEIPPFNFVEQFLLNRIESICDEVEATESPIIYLSGNNNFRDKIAVTRLYKGTRVAEKPFHYHNLYHYLVGVVGAIVIDGMEADDALAIEQTSREFFKDGCQAIICSRDKDLRQVPGWQYSWEVGLQPSFGPEYIDELGSLHLQRKDGKPAKLTGTGLMWFYAQCLTGDTVDNIPGLPKCGAVGTFAMLEHCGSRKSLEKAVSNAYKAVYEDKWKEHLLEQGRLLWMVRALHEDGSPVMWEMLND